MMPKLHRLLCLLLIGSASIALAGCHRGDDPREPGISGTTGQMVTPVPAVGGELRERVGQQVEITVDLSQAVNDVAFWAGEPPNDILVVLGRDVRSNAERHYGRSSERAIDLPASRMATFKGTIEAMPYAEEMHNWALTQDDVARLTAKGAYLRLREVVPPE